MKDMTATERDESLTGRLLVALPSRSDGGNSRTVILVCAHSDAGAFGVEISRPAVHLRPEVVLGKTGFGKIASSTSIPVHSGGPTDLERVIVLHDELGQLDETTIRVADGISLTSRASVIPCLMAHHFVSRFFAVMGYFVWDAGQLEEDLRAGRWLTTGIDPDDLFEGCPRDRWSNAMDRMHVAPTCLSPAVGHA